MRRNEELGGGRRRQMEFSRQVSIVLPSHFDSKTIPIPLKIQQYQAFVDLLWYSRSRER